MWIILSTIFVGGLTLIARGVFRQRQLQRRRVARLERLLEERGVEFCRLTSGHTYGWPTYDVELATDEQSSAFRQSDHYDALLAEVQSIHSGDEGFDATLAIGVLPPPPFRDETTGTRKAP